MENILADLYYGAIHPSDCNDHTAEYNEALQEIGELETLIQEKLKGDKAALDLLDHLLTAQNELSDVYAMEQFSQGFSLGIKILMEALTK